jgi:hypothetical protein
MRRSSALLVALLLAACAASSSSVSSVPPSASASTTLPGSSANGTPVVEQPWVQLGELPDADSVTITDLATDGNSIVAVGVAITADELLAPHFWLGDASGHWRAGSVKGEPMTGWPSSVAAANAGWVAVGWDGCTTPWPFFDLPACSSAIWRSRDGLSWTRIPEVERQAAALTSILEWRGRVVAAGGSGGPSQADRFGLVMASPDGQVWDELAPSPDDTLAGATITDLAAKGDEVVAVATYLPIDTMAIAPAAAWTTTDGSSWRGPEPMDSAGGFPVGVAVSPSGLVAVGFTLGSEWSSIPTAWIRTSGGWQLANMAGTDEGPALLAVAGSPAGALIAGYDPNVQELLLFGSADGDAWMRIPNSEELALPGLAPMTVAWAGDRFLLVVANEQERVPVVLAGVPHLPTAAEAASASPTPGPPVTSHGEVIVHIASGLDLDLGGTAECSGRENGPLLEVRANNIGEVGGHRVTLEVLFGSGFTVVETPSITIDRGFENAPQGTFLAPYYSGDQTALTLSGAAGDWSGRINFVGLYMVRPDMDVGDPVPLGGPGGPELIDGSIDWRCSR